MTDNENDWVGQAVPRFEDAALLTGNARFIDDLSPLPGIRHVAMLRSPHSHARILNINTETARALPGVTGIVTGQDIACLLYTSPSPRDATLSRMPSSA